MARKRPAYREAAPLIRQAIDSTRAANPGDLVLDPFMGVGSSGVTALKGKRNFIGFVVEATYYKVAEKRLEAVKARPF